MQVHEASRHHQAGDIDLGRPGGSAVPISVTRPRDMATSRTASRPDSGSITRPPRSTTSRSGRAGAVMNLVYHLAGAAESAR
jgi:hypothetical protein